MKYLRRNRTAVLMMLVAILFLSIGVWREEYEVVLRKAINICLECIGLG